MKKFNFRKPLIALCIMLGIVAIVATGNQPKPDTGEFVFFSVEKSTYCLNRDFPPYAVRLNFRAKSSSNQCVDIRINNIEVLDADLQTTKCGTGEWTDSYSFNLASIFGNNIPPTITITGQLLQKTAITVTPKLFDTATATITTSTNCPPPPPPGFTIGN